MMDTTYNVGIYCRLSNDDERDGESVSIENQKLLLQNYVRQRGWNEVDVYIDERIILGTSQEVLAPQGFPDLVLIFIWPEINGPYGRLIRKCVELSPLPIRRAA